MVVSLVVGTTERVPAAAAVEAYDRLWFAGWTQQQIADAVGVSRQTIKNVKYRRVASVPVGLVDKLERLPDAPPPSTGPVERVDAGLTLAVLDRVKLSGEPMVQVASRVGVDPDELHKIRCVRPKTVPAQIAEAVAGIYSN